MFEMKKVLLWFCLLCMLAGSCAACAEPEIIPANPTDAAVLSETMDEPAPEPLTVGAMGDAVLQMQQRLHVLGFFYTAQDGIYGANTQNAVRAFEEYLRLLEMDEIEREIEEIKRLQPTETPMVTIQPQETAAISTGADVSAQATEPPAPTATPMPTPQTIADGAADLEILEILYADADELYRRDARLSDQGLDVTRIQRRLVALNYLNDEPDGRYGVNTENAVKAFQQVHDLNETGVADRAMQQILFSEEAVLSDKPVYNQLYLGVTGDDVKAVQQQLKLLGFMNGSANGNFDAKTEEAVKQLEIYLHQLEMAEEKRMAAPVSTPTPTPTAEPVSEPTEDAEKAAVESGNADGTIPEDASTQLPGGTDAPVETPAATQPQEEAAFTSGAVPVNPRQTDRSGVLSVADGFVPTGIITAEMQILLLEEGIPVYLQNARKGDVSVTVGRVQRRLYALDYLNASGVDGIYGNGTQQAVLDFQKRNKLSETGIADQATQAVLFTEEAIKAIKPYLIKVSTDDQRVYIYTHDEFDEYNILVKNFICSTGLKDTPTPKGTFTNTGRGARWHYFKKFECWAQYAYYIDGDIMFHSVLYSDDDERTLNEGSVKRLGKKASHGCVRLRVEDAKWIWENCVAGTKVIVY